METQKRPRFLSLFPTNPITRMILGAWWIVEAIVIETPLYYYITTPYEQQILGPWNIIYYLSSLIAVIYGAVCFGLGWYKWRRNQYVKKNL